MKIGRVILTHRQDLVEPLKNFYLGSRTEFLVIGYNQISVDVSKFSETENFKLIPYKGPGADGSITGKQFTVWVSAAKKFPDIDFWICQDYDILIKPSDAELASLVTPNEYVCIGLPFYNWQKGMGPAKQDIFPFPFHYVSEADKKDETFLKVESVLLKYFPHTYQNTNTILTGYTDFIATARKNLLLLEDERLAEIEAGGLDQIVHTVFIAHNIAPKDLRQFYSIIISLDNTLYVPFKNKYDISHLVKFWPGVNKVPIKLKIKKLIKMLFKNARYAVSKPKSA